MVIRCRVLIIHPADPLGSKVGGAETFIKGFIKYAPEDFDIEFIGVSSNDKKCIPRKWIKLSLGKKEFNFYPLFFKKNEDKKSLIPLSINFTFLLIFKNIKLSRRVIIFNRIEPAILYQNFKVPKLLIMHTDRLRMLQKGSEVFWKKIPRLYSAFERKVFPSLAHIYCVSGDTYKFYVSEYSEEKYKFSFLPTFFDKEIFYPTQEPKEKNRQNILKEDARFPLKSKWVLFVGRLQEVKAPLRLIQAFWEYHKINNESCLLIIGTGNFEQKAKNYAEEIGMTQFVYFLGYKNPIEIAEYYRAADVMMLTSNFEGMPISVLEALGCGLPVVTTDVGEVRRVVKNGFSGEVVESFSAKDIAQDIELVLSMPDIYSKENCANSVSDYTPQKVLKPLYEKIRKLYSEKYL